MNRLRLVIGCIALSLRLGAADRDVGWPKLGTLERSNAYTILLRDRTCEMGKIRKVDLSKMTLESGNAVLRSEVLFVGQGVVAHEILYSGRSSWNDVKRVQPAPLEKLSVRLKSGRSMSGSVTNVSDSDLTIKRLGDSIKIPKHDIAQVDYIRFKPVSETHRYFAQEAVWLQFLDPKEWQYLPRIDALLSIRIYDIELPEDNSSLRCSNDVSRKRP